MKKLRILFLATVFLMCWLGTALSEQVPQIATSSLDYTSRYIFQLKDMSGEAHNIYIVPRTENKLENWVWSSKSDKVFQGEYLVFMSKSNSDTATLQPVYPFGSSGKNSLEGIFNLSKKTFQNRAFVLYGSKGNPDILCIAQQVTGSGDSIVRAFYINSNALKIIHWKNNDGQLLNSTYTDGFHPIEYTDNNNIVVPSWRRSSEYSGGMLTTWLFSPDNQTCTFSEIRKTKYDE